MNIKQRLAEMPSSQMPPQVITKKYVNNRMNASPSGSLKLPKTYLNA